MEIVKPVGCPDFQKQSAPPKPISTGAAAPKPKSTGAAAPNPMSTAAAAAKPISTGAAAVKPISTGAAHHVDKQSGVKKTSQQKNVSVPVVSKGHAGDIDNFIITTRGSSKPAATKGNGKELSGTE